ncbi:Uncharacterised protein [Mycobacterium tuberculosis]|uniref:Uncharacterized protein n=1 Tax=Mycobacterium tuberculosis TaxID=1773 RepID=A0A654ZH61_MYCTX|nr:Uncharacterised protein [Mycobacterium tuberculosis]CKU20600.1 Uncharacterised protein [Mycobacterium tuberculosis]CNM33467.1 Uncharacterised protein [Mycobacterium tuberculosis]CNV11253.1 Uncharacterised protein [Mycobacterium tuberculosis]COW77741.1 Uncharacterised protein [Mycobacterium tuberculosis]
MTVQSVAWATALRRGSFSTCTASRRCRLTRVLNGVRGVVRAARTELLAPSTMLDSLPASSLTAETPSTARFVVAAANTLAKS